MSCDPAGQVSEPTDTHSAAGRCEQWEDDMDQNSAGE